MSADADTTGMETAATLTARQQITAVQDTLLDRVEAEGLYINTLTIETGLIVGRGRTLTIAKMYTTRIGDKDRSPSEVVVIASIHSDEADPIVTVA